MSYLQLSGAIYASALTKSTQRLSTLTQPIENSDLLLAHRMVLKLLTNPLVTADQLALAHQLNSWLRFYDAEPADLDGLNRYEQIAPLLQKSLELRPTWPHTYLMLANATVDLPEKQKLLVTARQFGPVNPNVTLYELQLGFEQWEYLATPDKAALASKLVNATKNHKLRMMLNARLPYTFARTKICNLLKFNQIYLDNCKG
jgi:hypothetical protein